MADWDTTPANSGTPEVALRETTNEAPTGPPRDEAKIQLVREKGWVEQQPFNYAATAAPPAPLEAASDDKPFNGEALPGWMSRASKYEWKDEYGDVGPRVPELEKELFGSELRAKKGINFDELLSIKTVAEATERPNPVRSFDDAGLHPIIRENIRMSGYDVPTPVQAYTIPSVLKGRDVIAVAQTGSGKTAAYLAPTLSKLMGKAKKLCAPRPFYVRPDYDHKREHVRGEPLILVVAPTRELCIQIFDEARRLCYRSMLRPCVAYGGGPTGEQRIDLQKGCDILIATPGRLIDFMSDSNVLTLSRLRFTIIDEADEMLQDDWTEDLEKIMNGAGANMDSQHQFLLFSATFDKTMRRIAKKYLAQDYVRIRIGRTGSTVHHIKQQIVWVDRNKKKEALYDLLIASPPARTLIFCQTKKSVDIIDDFLFNQGLPTTSIHSDRTQLEREDAIRAFRRLDIRNVMHVINFDLPGAEYHPQDEYIHRIGRTGRTGNNGLATSFYNERDEHMAPFLAKILVENKWDVPDFLEEYKPAEDQELDFEDESGDEENEPMDGVEQANGADDAWGSAPAQPTAPVEDAWGSGGKANGVAEREDVWGNGNAAASGGGGW
ncbi:hypothetical protein PMZ80_008802 [Knufia obscura]|uniref:RNA helicase n=1 Tax=Knufia obscura TaxID=1635080 RepID=A0ABR0RDA2_9EURO|nr:hypothetical protein PMZ80_008802 [Knufia obscura]